MMTTAQYIANSTIYFLNVALKKCDSVWNTYKDLNRRLKYHCHLTDAGEIYFNIDNNDTREINRRIFGQRGLPIRNIYLAKGRIIYDANRKLRICALWNVTKTKYEWMQIIYRVNSKRNNDGGINKILPPQRSTRGTCKWRNHTRRN